MDQNFVAKFTDDSTNTLRRVIAQAQNLFYDRTFATRITLQIVNVYQIPTKLGLLVPETL